MIRLGLSKDDLIIKCAFYLVVLDNFDIIFDKISVFKEPLIMHSVLIYSEV